MKVYPTDSLRYENVIIQLTSADKMLPKTKKVSFSTGVVFYIGEDPYWKIYRAETWAKIQADRLRFQERISHLENILSPVLAEEHRRAIIIKNGLMGSL